MSLNSNIRDMIHLILNDPNVQPHSGTHFVMHKTTTEWIKDKYMSFSVNGNIEYYQPSSTSTMLGIPIALDNDMDHLAWKIVRSRTGEVLRRSRFQGEDGS